MRELTKSMLSYTWAMSMFGMRQVGALLQPQTWESAAASFDAVNRCTDDNLGPLTRSTFRAGDTLQRGVVDLMFRFLNPGAGRGGWSPGSSAGWGVGRGDAGPTGNLGNMGNAGNAANQFLGLGIDFLQRGVNLAYQTMGAASGQQPQGQSGWGPVPPPPSA
jgi:hypothetical protein